MPQNIYGCHIAREDEFWIIKEEALKKDQDGQLGCWNYAPYVYCSTLDKYHPEGFLRRIERVELDIRCTWTWNDEGYMVSWTFLTRLAFRR